MGDLEQRVARMIADMRQKELGVDFGGFDGYTDEGKQTAIAEARAIIPMVLEEAARVAETLPGWGKRSAIEHMDAIAAAIRAIQEQCNGR